MREVVHVPTQTDQGQAGKNPPKEALTGTFVFGTCGHHGVVYSSATVPEIGDLKLKYIANGDCTSDSRESLGASDSRELSGQ